MHPFPSQISRITRATAGSLATSTGHNAERDNITVNIENKNIGTVGYSLTAELTDEVRDVLVEQGLLRILQGPVASEYETKALALVFPEAKDKDGKYSRKSLEAAIAAGTYPAFLDEDGKPRKFSRTDLPYSEELGKLWVACCKGAEVQVGEDGDKKPVLADLGISEVTVAQYDGATKAEPKFAREKAFITNYLGANGGKLKDGSARTAATFAEGRGLAVPVEPWAEDGEFLAAVKVWLTAKLAEEAAQE